MPAPLPKYITSYYNALQAFGHHGATTEGATRIAFQNLLSEAGKAHGFTVLAEQSIQVGKRKLIRLDGEVKDQLKLRRGIWEAKDTKDDLDTEIKKKIAAGYPTKNIIFENTERAVLYQNGKRVADVDIRIPGNLQQLLDQFFDYTEPMIDEFHVAVRKFREEIPNLAAGLGEIITQEKDKNKTFRAALDAFLELCRASLNPTTTMEQVEDMLKQHLLTERIFRSVFNNPDFVQRNAIARELEKVVAALTSRAFSRSQFLSKLDYFYKAIELAAGTISDYSEKQSFLNTVYEQFFQAYSTKSADTHGIVYTPDPIVKWMVNSVEQVLQREFNLSLSDKGVHVLDPCVGTGTFMLELMDHIGPSALPHKYAHELHCNEVMLLPYYIAAQNIEHEYFERTGQYVPFEGICFADTLDMGRSQLNMFAPENTQRVQRQEDAPIFVIVGNPPYNIGQESENDNNKNRKYSEVDRRVRDTYARSSLATNKNALSDIYVRFFRWATDRLKNQNGVIAFVSNNSFLDQIAFDGMRKELLKEFTQIYVIDLGGNVRHNPKLSGNVYNVFGIQIGVAITLLIRNTLNSDKDARIVNYYRVQSDWNKIQKFDLLLSSKDYRTIDWLHIVPDSRATWTPSLTNDYYDFFPIGTREAKASVSQPSATLFKTYSRGVATSRDSWVFNFHKDQLVNNIKSLISVYNAEVDRWIRREAKDQSVDDFVLYDDARIKWSRDLKLDLQRSKYAIFSLDKVRDAIYRPFCRQKCFFDRILNEEVYVLPSIFPPNQENMAICATGVGAERPFATLISNYIPDLNFFGPGTVPQWFPFYTYDEDGSSRRENITDWALNQYQSQYGTTVTKWNIFHYVYGLLHSPDYRSRYAANLKRDLPHIPFVAAADFWRFVAAGERLAELHVHYEQQPEYKLKHVENAAVPWSWRVEKMKLSKDKTALIYNEALTLDGIPPEVFDYKLGNRSALEWIIDQYQVSTDKRSGIVSDPNNEDDPEYIVRLIKQVITVSLETVQIVAGLPALVVAAGEGS